MGDWNFFEMEVKRIYIYETYSGCNCAVKVVVESILSDA